MARQTVRRLKSKSGSAEFNKFRRAVHRDGWHANLPLATYLSRPIHVFHLQTVCTLFLYNATRENVIAVARLGTDNPPLNSSQAQSLQHLLRVKVSESRMDLFALHAWKLKALVRELDKPTGMQFSRNRETRKRACYQERNNILLFHLLFLLRLNKYTRAFYHYFFRSPAPALEQFKLNVMHACSFENLKLYFCTLKIYINQNKDLYLNRDLYFICFIYYFLII